MSNTRRFSPIFVATITPASVKTGTAKNGNKYARMSNASVVRDGQEPIERTVMAFGNAHAEVKGLLRKNKPVQLAVQHDGGTLKVIGLPRAAAA